ncbi:MAG: tripartite tricarboxylate transporter TctB family protein [Acetobacteraceae bacterium]|nr:tripartite tricarboxylate transporter TctB family protein [Acetobacteraceae bacterium]
MSATHPELIGTVATAERGPSLRAMEIATAVLLMAAGGIAMADSVRVGMGWGADGPLSGTFPFWLGVILVLASLGNLVSALRMRAKPGSFATLGQLRLVATVLAPTAAYVALIPFGGIYVTSAVLIAFFMIRFGEFRWRSAVPAGLAASLLAFMTFEQWFLVPLPKGPVETFLGF